ncbi:MAG: cofactor-independent phosphoglycerate mutase [Deltaproteobacteria bacterium]|nr:MAG: cofactor-independent phosphoglycerate mutase [Deltaproteobacteria bacterium]
MKIAVLLGDGMSGLPLEELGGRTTLEAASTPNMDRLAREGVLGMAKTVPDGYPAGSDVANLSVFGFDPAECYTGRAPIEAAAMGVDLGPDDVAYRMNLVTLLMGQSQVYMHDFTADHISNEEAAAVVKTLSEELSEDGLEFYPGVGYRNLMVWRGGEDGAKTTPPHDITGQPIHEHFPQGAGADKLLDLMLSSQMVLKRHPVNQARREEGRLEVNSSWLWGQGKRPRVERYDEKFGLTGTVISAVDLLKGIGILAGLDAPDIEGATGYIDTNYENKVNAALEGLGRGDFVYVHIEAPDETGHQGDMEKKLGAIEAFDEKVVGPIVSALENSGEEFRVIIMPDHPTPIAHRTHISDAVPFILYGTGVEGPSGEGYNEKLGAATGLYLPEAHKLMAHVTGQVKLW